MSNLESGRFLTFMIPIHSIREIVQLHKEEVTEVAQLGQALRIRNKMTPIVNLERALESSKFIQSFNDSVDNNGIKKQNTYIVIESAVGLSAL